MKMKFFSSQKDNILQTNKQVYENAKIRLEINDRCEKTPHIKEEESQTDIYTYSKSLTHVLHHTKLFCFV